MFYVFRLFTLLFRRFMLSRALHAQEREEIYRLVSKNFNFMPSGSVFDCFCLEALKMAENEEKLRFTFFAFLPPYFGVSGLLVSGMRKISMRSIDWYQKFLISWLAARYSTVFVFYCRQNVKIDFLKFNLLPNEPIESFWDALWLGIRPLLCFMVQKSILRN